MDLELLLKKKTQKTSGVEANGKKVGLQRMKEVGLDDDATNEIYTRAAFGRDAHNIIC